MIPSIITIISGNLSQNSGGYNSDIIGIRDIICFSNKSGILPETYFVTSHHMFSIISGILGIFSHSEGGSRAVVVVVEEEDASAVGQEVDICRVVELSILPPAPAPPSNAVLNKVFFRFVSLFICEFTATNFVSCYSTWCIVGGR